ncbi:nucleotidyltransferase family protein [uncultured Aliiroseovarius sp.]|uniref:nucleotidyltransferase family protein n=1 Tax=uncultured Aliiroseovarius sp. TaxID=1658783 RepID=UPI00261706E5|nr:nucleotidyltransferase family protein [uncultured Aliiroseovarius sp.]
MPPAPHIAILVMAAGQSLRMGCDKLLLRQATGQTLLEDRISVAIATGHPVYVALGDHARDRHHITRASGANPVLCADAELGMGHCMAQAVATLPARLDAILVLLADMPAITTEDINRVCSSFDGKHVIRGAEPDGTAGHPVLFPAQMRPQLEALCGDTGAKEVVKTSPARLVHLPRRHATTDIDRQTDWDSWQQAQGRANGDREP